MKITGAITRLASSLAFLVFSVAFEVTADGQTVIRVPQDRQTIQTAIDTTSNGDTVSISPGLYPERINFHGKAIIVQGAANGVVIDGGLKGAVVTFNSGETRTSVLKNVTIQNGAPLNIPDAGGVLIMGASPIIENSIIQLNHGCGIASFLGSPLIEDNVVSGTTASIVAQGETDCLGPGGPHGGLFGAAIQVNQRTANGLDVQILGNSIHDNTTFSGAVVVEDAGRPLIENNHVFSNTASDLTGGVWVAGDNAPRIVQNLIVANTLNAAPGSTAFDGAGLVLNVTLGSFSNMPSEVTNNTIAGNDILLDRSIDMQAQAQIAILGYPNSVHVSNNLIIGTFKLPPIICKFRTLPGAVAPTFDHNDVFGSPSLYNGDCIDQTGAGGNISSNPLFASQDLGSPNPFQLQPGSLAIDSGTNQALGLPQFDLAGQPRVQNATGIASATVDMGVYEYKGIAIALPPPPAWADFTLRTNVSSLTLQTEHHGVVVVAGTPQSSSIGTVSLSCVTPGPSYVTCTFQPAQFNLSGGITKTAQLTIDTSAIPGYALNGRTLSKVGIFVCTLFVPIGLMRRKQLLCHSYFLAILVFLQMLGFSGCSGKLPASTPPGSYTVMIVGNDPINQVSANVSITLVVTP